MQKFNFYKSVVRVALTNRVCSVSDFDEIANIARCKKKHLIGLESVCGKD